MKYLTSILTVLLITVLSTSCVTKKKYKELELLKDHYSKEYDALKLTNEENQVLKNSLKDNNAQLKSTTLELQEAVMNNDRLNQQYEDILARYERLLEQNNSLLATSSDEKMQLQQQLLKFEAELDQKKQELDGLQYMLDQKQNNLDALLAGAEERDQQSQLLAQQLNEKEQQINDLQALLNAKDSQMAAIKANINNALRNFSASDLTVEEKNNKIYVSLSQNLLFKTGSDQIDWKGKKAIMQVAEVLKSNSDITINVEGHTDSDGDAATNWDLSTRRATSVVKILTSNGVSPQRITASGRAFYVPIAPNDTAENKAKNRRTEIILSPNLDALYDILKQ